MEFVLLSGGLGTRLRPLTFRRPKVLVPLAGRPILDYVLRPLAERGFTIVFAVSERFLSSIERHVRENWSDLDCVFHVEREPLGTGGAVKNCEESITGRFLVGNADVITSVDPSRLLDFHERRGGMGSISLYETREPHHYGVVMLEETPDGGGGGGG
ncbi:MAG: nucleotidyltransferase family protein, partial [Thermoplasmata archaeon]|nr:nucleotidyltransferase family protein [Thermoplasmata archaeon]